ncbi:MAG: M56 family metallopeptidase [bacterium]
MLKGRGPVRIVWIAALALSVVGPAFGYTVARRVRAPVAVTTAATSTMISEVGGDIANRSTASQRSHRGPDVTVRASARVSALRDLAVHADRPLAVVWALLSLGLFAYVVGGVLRLRKVRRGWRAGVVNGTAVMISDDAGPALVGVIRSSIVIPEWALGLEPNALSLMLRHELEHQAAGDTRLLALAEALLVLMPWSPVVWWQIRRLRLAIEIDCDARVLRAAPDIASYGRLLLEFGRTRRDVHFAGAALADHASHLEERIRRLTARPAMNGGVAGMLSCAAAALAILVGCQLPAPSTPGANAPKPNPAPIASPAASVADSLPRSSEAREFAVMQVDDERRRLTMSDPLLKQYFDTKTALYDSAHPAQRAELLVKLAGLESTLKSLPDRIDRANSRDAAELKLIAALDTIYDQNPAIRSERPRRMLEMEHSLAEKLTARAKAQPDSFTAASFHGNERLPGWEFSKYLPDSAAAAWPNPGCSVKSPGDGEVVRLLISDEDAARAGTIRVTFEATTDDRSKIVSSFGMCSSATTGEFRAFGRGAFDGTPIIVSSPSPLSIVVQTGSGRVMAGPLLVRNETRNYDFAWGGR